MRPLVVGLVFAALAACGGCRSKSDADAASAPSTPQVSQAWLDGMPLPETGSPTDGGVLVVRVMSEPAGLNFLDDAFHDAWVARLTRQLVVESLLAVDPKDFSLQPSLAEAWDERDEHHVTRFTLRAGATFSTGATVTSKDVVATVAAVLDPRRATGAARGELAGLSGCAEKGERTVECTWATPSPAALRALVRLPIYSAAQLAGDWSELAKAPVGSGPFVVKAWERGSALTLERRPGGAAYLERIVFRFVKDHTVAGAMFEKGEFDVMTSIQPVLWRAMEQDDPKYAWAKSYRRLRTADNSFSYIAWNEAVPAFADVRVRRALAHLYDATLVARVVDLDLELPTSCPFLHGSDSCEPGLGPVPFSPPAAEALLADAGFTDSDGDGVRDRDGKPLRFTFLLPSASVRLGKLVPLLQEQLKPVGVELGIEKVETATLSARVAKRDFEVVSRVWTEFDREHDVYPYFHSSQIDGGSNFVGFSDPELDRLLDQVRGEFDVAKRRELERAVHRRLVETQPYLFMTNRQTLDAAKARVHGLAPSVVWYDLRQVWVDAPP
ncbi:MAG: ABC transporter substrate-binding protein [Myxococcota bacterium]